MDYLSFLTIRVKNNPQYPPIGHAGLYHTELRFQSCESGKLVGNYPRIGCFLDNDTAGRNACKHLQAKFGERLFDKSLYYREYNDLNDYLCGKSLSQSTEPMKLERQVQSARRMMQPPKKRGIPSIIYVLAIPWVFRQKYHSSIGRFLHALLRNAKNTPIEPKGNPFGNPVSQCHSR